MNFVPRDATGVIWRALQVATGVDTCCYKGRYVPLRVATRVLRVFHLQRYNILHPVV